jgi:tRNA modification GTPase
MLNALLRTERAIVTPIAGTTRDTVEEVANLRGIPLHLIDTAGITPTDDPIERIGVQRSRIAAEGADVLLLVFDGSEALTKQDRNVCSEVQAMGFGTTHDDPVQAGRKRPVVVVVNKADAVQVIDMHELQHLWPSSTFVHTSTRTGSGLSTLEDTLAELVLAGKTVSSESVLVTSARHQEALQRAAEHLQASRRSLEQNLPLDFVSIDLRAAYEALGEVTGEAASDDLLDTIFHEFCIGK